jgi:hypothetical protein
MASASGPPAGSAAGAGFTMVKFRRIVSWILGLTFSS